MSELIYNKTNWKDDETTPINARNLNNLEDGIEYIYHKWDEIISDATTGDHAAELIDARNGKDGNNKTLGQRLDKIDAQFNTKANKDEVRMNNSNITLNDCDSEMLGAIQGGEGASFELLSIPRDNSVEYNKLNKKLQDNFKVDYESVSLTMNRDGFWDMENGQIASNTGNLMYADEINVVSNEEFLISGYSSWRANLYLIKNSNDEVIETFPNTNETTKEYSDIKFTIPDGGVKLCVNGYTDRTTKLYKLANISLSSEKIVFKENTIPKNVLEKKLSDLFENDYKEVDVDWITGSYYRWENNNVIENANSSRAKINVAEGQEFLISGTSYWEANLYYITDVDDNIIATFPNTNETTTVYSDIEFTIPEDGAYLLINQKDDSTLTTLKNVSKYKVKLDKLFKNKKWVAFGDSLTDSATLGSEYNYTNFVADNLGLTCINLGKGGTGYINNNGGSQQFYNRTSSIPSDADVLTVFGSFNDLYIDDIPIGEITDTEPTTLYGAINKFLSNCWVINPSVIIGIISPTPWRNWWRGHSDSARVEKCVNYVQVLKNIAEYYSLPFLDLFSCSNLRPWEDTIKDLYYLNADGIHPNSKGHKKYIVPKIESFIKSIIN